MHLPSYGVEVALQGLTRPSSEETASLNFQALGQRDHLYLSDPFCRIRHPVSTLSTEAALFFPSQQTACAHDPRRGDDCVALPKLPGLSSPPMTSRCSSMLTKFSGYMMYTLVYRHRTGGIWSTGRCTSTSMQMHIPPACMHHFEACA